MKYLLILPIRLYQILLSPWIGHHCRYVPSCSEYTKQAITKHGAVKGCFLGALRILSCNPWSKKEMDDPVPKRFAWRAFFSYKKRSR